MVRMVRMMRMVCMVRARAACSVQRAACTRHMWVRAAHWPRRGKALRTVEAPPPLPPREQRLELVELRRARHPPAGEEEEEEVMVVEEVRWGKGWGWG